MTIIFGRSGSAAEQLFQMRAVVVPEDVFLGAAVPEAIDDGRVVLLVREDDAVLQTPREDRESSVVRR